MSREPNIYSPCFVCGEYTRGYNWLCKNHNDNSIRIWIGDKRDPYSNPKKPNYHWLIFDYTILELLEFQENKIFGEMENDYSN